VSFSLNENGYTKNVSIVDSSPPKIFDKSVIVALEKWRFRLKDNGGRIDSSALMYQLFKFNLEQKESIFEEQHWVECEEEARACI